ncbi:MAG TPA: hypothetical protein VF292_13670 [Rhodanobacteraceae bacterium]
MTETDRTPIWLMGMTRLSVGMLGGIVTVTVPQLLASDRVPEGEIAALTAAAFSPVFWAFLICPILDVHFTRRFYAIIGAVVTAVLTPVALLGVHHLALIAPVLIVDYVASVFMQNALGGWFSAVVSQKDNSRIGAWMQVGTTLGFGLTAISGFTLMRHSSALIGAIVLGVVQLVPLLIYPFIPVTRSAKPVMRGSFVQFFRDISVIFRQRRILLALAMFLLPSAAFALTNVLSGLGDVFRASPEAVSIAGGTGVIVAGIIGSLSLPRLAHIIPVQPLYLLIGIVGASFTLSTLLLPHVTSTFVITVLVENVFQSLALAAAFSIMFSAIGNNNPLAATTFAVLDAAVNFPIDYMTALDGRAFEWHGLLGSYGVDAGLSIVSCVLLLALLTVVHRHSRRATADENATAP